MNLIFYTLAGLLASLFLYLSLRPQKGWWYLLKNSAANRERIILEDILKHLYNTEQGKGILEIKNLVKQLPFPEKQILEVLTEMEDRELVYILEQKIRLSKKGKEYAMRIVRAHRLWEQYLAEKTGYDKREWHKLAEKEEHNLTDEYLEQLSKELRRPLFDPHGSPIPYDKDRIKKLRGKSLSSFEQGIIGRIVEIEDEPASIYQKILEENIHLGAQVRILENDSKNVRFFSEGREHNLPTMIANALTIIPLAEEDISEQLDRLSRLKIGEKATIKGISRECRGENRRRLLDLGFVKGTEITISSYSPLQDPIAYNLRNTLIALREEQSQYILIQKEKTNE